MAPQAAGSPPAVAALGFLLPIYWEIEVTCAAAMILVALYATYELLNPRPSQAGAGGEAADGEFDGADKFKGGSSGPSAYVVKLELLAAKNLMAANLNGTSDPYALITCVGQRSVSGYLQRYTLVQILETFAEGRNTTANSRCMPVFVGGGHGVLRESRVAV